MVLEPIPAKSPWYPIFTANLIFQPELRTLPVSSSRRLMKIHCNGFVIVLLSILNEFANHDKHGRRFAGPRLAQNKNRAFDIRKYIENFLAKRHDTTAFVRKLEDGLPR